MNQHTITASIEFYFKGERFLLSSTIDLANWIQKHQADMVYLYNTIALEHGLDQYRYEYDVMVMEPIQFSQPTGLARSFFHGDTFDIEGFHQAFQRLHTIELLNPLLRKHLQLEFHTLQPEWQQTLLQAFELGKQHAQKRSGYI